MLHLAGKVPVYRAASGPNHQGALEFPYTYLIQYRYAVHRINCVIHLFN